MKRNVPWMVMTDFTARTIPASTRITTIYIHHTQSIILMNMLWLLVQLAVNSTGPCRRRGGSVVHTTTLWTRVVWVRVMVGAGEEVRDSGSMVRAWHTICTVRICWMRGILMIVNRCMMRVRMGRMLVREVMRLMSGWGLATRWTRMVLMMRWLHWMMRMMVRCRRRRWSLIMSWRLRWRVTCKQININN